MTSVVSSNQQESVSRPRSKSKVSFIGVDLAWKEGNNTGLAAFDLVGSGAEPAEFGQDSKTLDSVVNFILEHRAATTVVAIDAPLIIANETGRRPCETLISRRFSKAHAGAHSSNRKLLPEARSVELVRLLEAEGFRHCSAPDAPWSAEGLWFFEVYPHPAQVVLFERERIIRYKKGRVADRKQGLEELRSEIRSRMLGGDSFRSSESLDRFLATELETLRGQALKEHEDALDAIVCSYLAFHLWRWGWKRSEMFGNLDGGYIVVPTVSLPRKKD